MHTAAANRSSKFEGSSQAQNSRITKNDLQNIYADFISSNYILNAKKLSKSNLKNLEEIWQIQNKDPKIENQKTFLGKTIGKNQREFNFSKKFNNFAFDLLMAALLERRRAFLNKYSSGKYRLSITPKFINSLNRLYSSL